LSGSIGQPAHALHAIEAQEIAVNLKTALLAVTAVAALLGAAIIGVPSTWDRANEPVLTRAPAE
jgi:hypothetical protein